MSRQIILSTVFTVIFGFSAMDPINAQLKTSDNTNQILVDLSVIDAVINGHSTRQSMRMGDKLVNLLKPPTIMPRSIYRVKPSATTDPDNSLRIKLKPYFKSSKKLYNRRGIANKTTLQSSSKRALKQSKSEATTLKPPSRNKSIPPPSLDFKKPVKILKTNPEKSLVSKKVLAPTPMAVPLAPVKTLKMPPPVPNLVEAKTKTKLIRQQIASRQKKIAPPPATNLLIFKQGNSKLSKKAKKSLDTLSEKLKNEQNYRVQIQAYAGEPNLTASKARRLSLSRALSVRSHLIKNGIRSTRIDVRALGNKISTGKPNRVDLKLLKTSL